MPIYEYQCAACGHEFERLQGIGEVALTDCPGCSESQLRLKLTAAAFHLKGTGWYETDFKGKDKKKEETGSDTSKADSDTKTDDKRKSGKKTSEKKTSGATAESNATA